MVALTLVVATLTAEKILFHFCNINQIRGIFEDVPCLVVAECAAQPPNIHLKNPSGVSGPVTPCGNTGGYVMDPAVFPRGADAVGYGSFTFKTVLHSFTRDLRIISVHKFVWYLSPILEVGAEGYLGREAGGVRETYGYGFLGYAYFFIRTITKTSKCISISDSWDMHVFSSVQLIPGYPEIRIRGVAQNRIFGTVAPFFLQPHSNLV